MKRVTCTLMSCDDPRVTSSIRARIEQRDKIFFQIFCIEFSNWSSKQSIIELSIVKIEISSKDRGLRWKSHALWRFRRWRRGKNHGWYFIRQQIRFTNAAFTAAFSVGGGAAPERGLVENSWHHQPREYSGWTDAESYRGNIFCTGWRASRRERIYMLEKIANYFDRFSMLPLQPPPSSSCAVCVFLEIFHLSRRYFRALESVARLGRKKEKVRKYARSLFVTILELWVKKKRKLVVLRFSLSLPSMYICIYVCVCVFRWAVGE